MSGKVTKTPEWGCEVVPQGGIPYINGMTIQVVHQGMIHDGIDDTGDDDTVIRCSTSGPKKGGSTFR